MFFDRPETGELAVLVHLDLDNEQQREDPREFEELVLSAGGDPVAFLFGHRRKPDPGYFIGTGKREELLHCVHEHNAGLVIFNHALSPSQERNLERELGCRVLDRNGLILDIFAQRARSHTGKLQVELAQLRHVSTRLVRGWTHLERQKGGIGLRGPGETQLETDRRLIRERIRAIENRLQKVHRQREQGRRGRERARVPVVSFVGYTNAGKSTLFNALTDARVYAADKLFATLDPTMRRCALDEFATVILADTVGFIRNLPHQLVEAFRATLDEARNAQLLLHIIDAAAPERRENVEQVDRVLREIGADEVPCLEIFNKIDRLDGVEPRLERDSRQRPSRVWCSASTGIGLGLVRQAISELTQQDIVRRRLALAPNQGRLRAKLYQMGGVLGEQSNGDGSSTLELRLRRAELNRVIEKERQRELNEPS